MEAENEHEGVGYLENHCHERHGRHPGEKPLT
jgi:hypothetical protein